MRIMGLSTYIVIFAVIVSLNSSGYAEEKHNHSEDKKTAKNTEEKHGEKGHKHGEDEDNHDDHAEGEGHEEHGEGAGEKIGPGKGIVEADEEIGISLAPEAIKNFEIEEVEVKNASAIVPASAVVKIANGEFVYRQRSEYFKRVSFKAEKLPNNKIRVTSSEFFDGDKIVVKGESLLRVAEMFAFEAEAGHSH